MISYFFLAITFAVAHCAPLSDEERVIYQLLFNRYNHMDGMQAKVSNLPWLHHYSPYNPSLQSQPMSAKQLKNSVFEKCFQPVTERLTNLVKQSKDFGIDDPFWDQFREVVVRFFQNYLRKNSALVEYINSLLRLIVKFNSPQSGSVEIVSQQGNILFSLIKDVVNYYNTIFGIDDPLLQYLINIMKFLDNISLNNTLTSFVEYWSSN